jgi:hypothetical protein
MKMYLIGLAAVLSIAVLSTMPLTTHASRAHTTAPPTVTVRVTPTRLTSLDRATIAATFSSAGSATGPYTATLVLRPQSGERALTAAQGGFRLHHGQPLSVYWEWRAGAALPPGVYTVRVQLSAVTRQVVTSGTARASLIIVRHP